MKYISPTTEKRRQRRKQRQKKLLIAGAVLLLAIVVGCAVMFVMDGDNTPSISASQSEQSSQPESEISSAEVEDSSSENISSDQSEDTSSDSEESSSQPEEKPKKKKKSIFERIKALFAKTEPIPVTYPATVFGKTLESEINEIASLSPFATEIILSSPSQNALVALSSYCNKRGSEVMTIGTPLIPDVDKIIQLNPDCLIIQTPLSSKDRAEIEQAGITVYEVSNPESYDDIKELYRSVTALTQGADIAAFESERVITDMTEKMNMYAKVLENENKLNVVMMFNSFGMVATHDTAEGMLLSHFFDVKEYGKDYLVEDMASLVATNPQVIILSDKMTEQDIADLGLGETEAVANDRVFYVDISEFEILSPKAIKTLAGIANNVYGDTIKPLPPESEETED